MKKIKILLFFLLAGSSGMAQGRSVKAIEAAVEDLRLAMVKGDSLQLDKLTSDALTYGHSSGHVDDKNDFIQKLSSGKSDFVSITLTGQNISVSGKVAIVRHKLDAETNDGGKPGEVHLLVMLVWQKQHGQWKLLARQAVKSQ